jgi:hypothetical protein
MKTTMKSAFSSWPLHAKARKINTNEICATVGGDANPKTFAVQELHGNALQLAWYCKCGGETASYCVPIFHHFFFERFLAKPAATSPINEFPCAECGSEETRITYLTHATASDAKMTKLVLVARSRGSALKREMYE